MASLKLQTNVPETIALEFADGLPVESQFGGDQKMFSLVDGRKFYCSPFVAQKIAAAGIAAKQPFTICKREISQGNRRTVEYQIQIEAAAFSENATAAIGSTYSSNLTTQAYNGNAARQLHAVAAPAPAPTPAPAPDMAGCYREAIEVTLGAISYAKEQGLLLTPTFEDIRCMAATLLIDSRKGGRA